MSPLEPGCLALVIATARTPELVGIVVQCEYLVGHGEEFVSPTGEEGIYVDPDQAWMASSDSIPRGWGLFAPSHLMRLDGGDPTRRERDRELTV